MCNYKNHAELLFVESPVWLKNSTFSTVCTFCHNHNTLNLNMRKMHPITEVNVTNCIKYATIGSLVYLAPGLSALAAGLICQITFKLNDI